MTAEEVARRFAGARSGYRLISYREVALPLFKIDLELLVLERKALPPIQEYVLRSVESGLVQLTDVAGLLGVDESVVRSAAADLLAADCLILTAAGEHDRTHRLALTRKGQRTAAEAASVQPVEATLPVWVDGLTRQVLSVTGKGRQWFPASRSGERGLVEIPAYPRRRPTLESVPFESVQAVIRAESAGRHASREVVGITGMGKARRFAREAVALAYSAPHEDEPLITLMIDGEHSEAHDKALAQALAHSTRRVVPEDWHSARALAQVVVGEDVLAQTANTDLTASMEQERDALRSEDRVLRTAAQQAPPDELKALRERLAESDRRQTELQRALDNISVRQVPVYEHPGYLRRALEEAHRRVLIVSPWIRFEVVNDELIGRMRKTLDRGVELWIAYGIKPEGGYRSKAKGEGDREAERKLRRLEEDYPQLFHMVRLGDTHAKVLVCDSRFSIVTSFNWLSFRGDDTLDFRDERGYYVGLSAKVDELFETYRARFNGRGDY